MLTLKQKLHSQRGASMLMAMIFLMFCLLIGGFVLSAATANSSRIEHLVNDQQDYLNQRSALTIMADMLTPPSENKLEIVFRKQTVTVNDTDITELYIDIPSENYKGDNIPAIQKILYDVAIDRILTKYYSDYDPSEDIRYSNPKYSLTSGRANPGNIKVTLGDVTLNAIYTVSFKDNKCILEIQFDEATEGAEDVVSHARLIMTGVITRDGDKVTIGWGIPSIQK